MYYGTDAGARLHHGVFIRDCILGTLYRWREHKIHILFLDIGLLHEGLILTIIDVDEGYQYILGII